MRQVPTGWKIVVPIFAAASLQFFFTLQAGARQVLDRFEPLQGRGADDASGQANRIRRHAQVFGMAEVVGLDQRRLLMGPPNESRCAHGSADANRTPTR